MRGLTALEVDLLGIIIGVSRGVRAPFVVARGPYREACLSLVLQGRAKLSPAKNNVGTLMVLPTPDGIEALRLHTITTTMVVS